MTTLRFLTQLLRTKKTETAPVALYMIEVDTHPETIGIVHFRYLSAHCPVAFAFMQTTGDEQDYQYKIMLLLVPDGSKLNECIIVDTKYAGSRRELAENISHLLLYAENTSIHDR